MPSDSLLWQIITVCGLSLGAAVDLMVSLSLVYHRLRTPRRAYEY